MIVVLKLGPQLVDEFENFLLACTGNLTSASTNRCRVGSVPRDLHPIGSQNQKIGWYGLFLKLGEPVNPPPGGSRCRRRFLDRRLGGARHGLGGVAGTVDGKGRPGHCKPSAGLEIGLVLAHDRLGVAPRQDDHQIRPTLVERLRPQYRDAITRAD
jgi:hypothetical protein